MTLTFREAVAADTSRICEIIAQAKAQMRALGSMQWQTGYPAREDITQDIARRAGWVLCTPNNCVMAYGAVIFDGEPAYDHLEGKWITDLPYVVVHRLAVADEAKRQGLAKRFMLHTEALARERGFGSFRVDTNFDNNYMLRMLAGLEFVHCGTIHYQSGERLAFEKSLETA